MKKVSDFKKNINKIETFITDKEWQTIFKIESLKKCSIIILVISGSIILILETLLII